MDHHKTSRFQAFMIFKQTNCEKKFDNSSDKAGIAQAGDLIDELKAAGKTFQDEVGDIISKIENCGGASLRSKPTACSDGTALDPASEFLYRHS